MNIRMSLRILTSFCINYQDTTEVNNIVLARIPIIILLRRSKLIILHILIPYHILGLKHFITVVFDIRTRLI